MTSFDVPPCLDAPSWLTSVGAPEDLAPATHTTLLSPGRAIFAALGGSGATRDLWSAKSLRAYCMARFGPSCDQGSWLLTTRADGFLVSVQPEKLTASTGLFSCRWTPRVEREFSEQKSTQNDAVRMALAEFRAQPSRAWIISQPSLLSPASWVTWLCDLATDPFDRAYDEFCRRGLREKAMARVVAPRVFEVEQAIAHFALEMMRPVTHAGQAITMAGRASRHLGVLAQTVRQQTLEAGRPAWVSAS